MKSHTQQATALIKRADNVARIEDMIALAQAHAALAIAEELRTANIIALATLQASQRDIDGARQLRDAAAERLSDGAP
jgi:hypothetical protein